MKHYAKIISFANHKGGVGKTTTTASMGSILASKGYKVLLVDLDAQANLTSSLLKKEVSTTIYDGLKSQSSTSLYIYKVREDIRLDMIPADLNLAQADLELAGKMARERILSELLENYKSEYDYILIDCPPSLGLLTLNSLAAADSVLMPIQCEFYALEGVSQLMNTIELVRTNLNPHLEVEGVLMTMYDGRTRLAEQVVAEVRENFGELVYETMIPRTVRLSEAPSYGEPILYYDKRSKGTDTYMKLAEEVMAHGE